MPEAIKLQKLAIKVDYKPTLAAYAKMDSVAIPLTHDFPQWQRSALSLEMRNPEVHSQFRMHFNNCYFECDAPNDASSSLSFGIKCVDTALRKFEVNKLEKVGIAQMFVASDEESFQDLVLRCDNMFHKPFASISAFDDCEIADTAYIVDAAERNSKWVHTIQVGPMTRSEFWGRFPLDPRVYDTEQHLASHYKNSVPENLFFISVDAGCTQCDRQQSMLNLPDVARRASLIAKKLHESLIGDNNG